MLNYNSLKITPKKDQPTIRSIMDFTRLTVDDDILNIVVEFVCSCLITEGTDGIAAWFLLIDKYVSVPECGFVNRLILFFDPCIGEVFAGEKVSRFISDTSVSLMVDLVSLSPRRNFGECNLT